MSRTNYYTPVPVDNSKLQIALMNAERKYDIAQRAARGETYEEIAKVYGISRQRVEQVLKGLYLSAEKVKFQKV